MLVHVKDEHDPRLDLYRQVRERDLVGRRHRFVAEGTFVVEHLCGGRTRFAIESLLLEERRVDSLRRACATLPVDVPVYVVSQTIMDRVVGFHIHRGVLGIGIEAQRLSIDDLLTRPNAKLVVCIEGVTNHDNVGGIFRNAAAFGADCVLMDHLTCHPLYRKAIRVSVGGSLLVPFAISETSLQYVESLEGYGFRCIALTPQKGAPVLEELLRGLQSERIALVLGSEEPGLSSTVLSRCEQAHIEMAFGFDSLNVSVASGIALHTVARHLGRIS